MHFRVFLLYLAQNFFRIRVKKAEWVFGFVSLLIILVLSIEKEDRQLLRIRYVSPHHLDDLVPVNSPDVEPVLYDTLFIDELALISERKEQFINQVLPAILMVKFELDIQFKEVSYLVGKEQKGLPLTKKEKKYLNHLLSKYKVERAPDLLIRLKPHPTSLVLAQAAVESGWGLSRFAIEGNNLFGMWSTATDPNKMLARFSRGPDKVYVKKYNSVSESIEHYFLTIGRNRAYRSFRLKRFEEANVYQLIDELNTYSENSDEYTRMLKHIIRWNKLERFDRYRIGPRFIPWQTRLKLKILEVKMRLIGIIHAQQENNEPVKGQE